jgi:hypothetical protein
VALSAFGAAMNWVVTLPQKIEWQDYEKELAVVANGSQQMNFRVANIPRNMQDGDKCFVVWRGKVRGWMSIVGTRVSAKPWVCTSTGAKWPPGKYIMRSGKFHAVDGPDMRGFQGIRKYDGDTTMNKAQIIAKLIERGHADLAEQLTQAQDRPDMIERTYTVKTNNGEFLDRFEKLLAAIQTLGGWGASRVLKFSVDGDGSDRLHVDGLKKEIGKSFNDLIDKDEVSVWDVKWKDEEKK